MHDRGPEPDVVEQRDPDAVEEVADVAGRRAAHEEERHPAEERRDAGHGFDRAERIAKSPRNFAHFCAAERARLGLLFAHHRDLDPLAHARSRRRRRGGCRLRGCVRLFGRQLFDFIRRRLDEAQLEPDARRDRRAVARRGLELETQRCLARVRGEGCTTGEHAHLRRFAGRIHYDLEQHDRMTRRTLRIRNDGIAAQMRRLELGCWLRFERETDERDRQRAQRAEPTSRKINRADRGSNGIRFRRI